MRLKYKIKLPSLSIIPKPNIIITTNFRVGIHSKNDTNNIKTWMNRSYAMHLSDWEQGSLYLYGFLLI